MLGCMRARNHPVGKKNFANIRLNLENITEVMDMVEDTVKFGKNKTR